MELSERLLEKEVIFKEDLEKIFGKRPFEKFDKLGQEKAISAPDEDSSQDNSPNETPNESSSDPSASDTYRESDVPLSDGK